MISVQRQKNISLVIGTPSKERSQEILKEILWFQKAGVPLFILDFLGDLAPLLLDVGIEYTRVSSVEEVPATGVGLVVNDGHGYLKLTTTPGTKLNPSWVVASVDLSSIQSL